jgi:hypothetical protein
MSKQAMLTAMLFPEPEKGGRGKKAENSKESLGFSVMRLSQARAVLQHSEALAKDIIQGITRFDDAVDQDGRRQAPGAIPLHPPRPPARHSQAVYLPPGSKVGAWPTTSEPRRPGDLADAGARSNRTCLRAFPPSRTGLRRATSDRHALPGVASPPDPCRLRGARAARRGVAVGGVVRSQNLRKAVP